MNTVLSILYYLLDEELEFYWTQLPLDSYVADCGWFSFTLLLGLWLMSALGLGVVCEKTHFLLHPDGVVYSMW